MKKVITILVALIISANSFIQAQDCLWAKSVGGTGVDYGNNVTTDANGNVYMTGNFESPTITIGTITLTRLGGGTGFFIAKYDANGNVLWAKTALAAVSINAIGNCVSTDTNGNVYISGIFGSPTITFDAITLTNLGVSSRDIFIVKYDASGNALWAKSGGGISDDYGQSISTDINGNVYISGYFNSPTITFGSTTLTSAGFVDIFIVKYDAGGNVIWAKKAGGTGVDFIYSISADASGNVYMVGCFSGYSITFNFTTISNNLGDFDVFIVKYNAAGNVLWVKRAGDYDRDIGRSITTDASGNLYITGHFNSHTISFGSTTLTNTGFYGDIFIVKLNAAGNVLWAKSVSGDSNDETYGISADSSGNVYISGYFSSQNITFGSTTLSKTGSNFAIFIAKYDTDGNALWAKSAGGNNNLYTDMGRSVAADISGNVYVTGTFNSPAITFGSNTLTNAGAVNVFIAKYSGTGTGVEEMIGNDEINISPNPATGKFTINLKFKVQNAKLLIVDVFGKEVYTTQINSESTEVDLSGVAKGLYFVNVGNEVKKLVIE
jgi:hypothetical protein